MSEKWRRHTEPLSEPERDFEDFIFGAIEFFQNLWKSIINFFFAIGVSINLQIRSLINRNPKA